MVKCVSDETQEVYRMNYNDKLLSAFEEVVQFLSSTFVFRDIERTHLSKIVADCDIEIKEFANGEKIFTPDDFEEKISGQCEVKKLRDEKSPLPLNTLNPGDSFGVLTLFATKESYPTEISAKKRSTVLFIPKREAVRLIENEPRIAKNFITFLSD